jgi:transposase
MRLSSLDEMLPLEHRARMVWDVVQGYDLGWYYDRIEAIEGEAGRPAIAPEILMAVWLYATLEGVGSARALARLCKEHIAYQWILGGVTVNYHTLADFRVKYERELDGILTKSVAALMNEGLVTLEQVTQDGMRVRTSAGGGSFSKRSKLEKYLEQAKGHVESLKQDQDKGETSLADKRVQAARKRHARERVERVQQALEEIKKVEEKKAKSHNKKKKAVPARSSTTDPEARFMKMPDGGFRPAYNAQLAVDADSRLIVGVDMINEVDQRQMSKMVTQIEKRLGRRPKEYFVDGGFVTNNEIETVAQKGIKIYAPLPEPRKPGSQPGQPRPSDGPGLREWRIRMSTEAAKSHYRLRAETVEWANALAKNRGLSQLRVRGKKKTRAVLLWYALAHNLMQVFALKQNSFSYCS